MKVAQVLVNQALNNFLNNGYTKVSFLLYPLKRNVKKDVIRDLRKAFANCVSLDIFHDFPKTIEITASEEVLAEFISIFYRGFDNWVREKGTTERIYVQCTAFKSSQYDTEYLRPVLRLKNYVQVGLKDFLNGFYIHGSISTLDYVKGWSDLDTFCIITSQTAKDPKKLVQLRRRLYESRKFFYAFDPLQHHGHFVVTNVDLRFYPSSLLPPVVLKHSKPLLGDEQIILNLRDDKSERINVLRSFCESLKRFANKKNADIYTRKFVYHMVLLLPTLFLQAVGKPTYKRESFDRARMYFDEDTWAVIDTVTKIRRNWNLCNNFTKVLKITPWNPKLGQEMFCLLSRFSFPYKIEENYVEFTRRAYKLADNVLKKLDGMKHERC